MRPITNYFLLPIVIIGILLHILVEISNGELIHNNSSAWEAESKYLLATDIYLEKAFDEVDALSHLVADEEAFALAIENLIESCNLNYAKACSDIGLFYANGKDLLRQDRKKAIFFLEKALSLGDYSEVVSLLYCYYLSGDYNKTVDFSKNILNSKLLKTLRDENSIFYCLKDLYRKEETDFCDYTKAYACCNILAKTDNIVTKEWCDNNYINKLSLTEIDNAKELIRKWMIDKIWDN